MTRHGSIDQSTMDTVRAAKGPIGSLGGAWMSEPAEEVATEEAGLHDWQLYFLGRHGVVGGADVDADVISAAAYVFPPDYLRQEWETACSVVAPEDAVARYLKLCHQWGREHLTDFAEAERLTDLAEVLVDSVDVAGLPLFAGWRALGRPTDPGARCAHSMQLLREHRGACHGVALVATGLSPLMAILAHKGGEENAIEYGWQPPFPPVTPSDRVLRDQAEELTDRITARPYANLSASEQAELVTLLDKAFQHCFEK